MTRTIAEMDSQIAELEANRDAKAAVIEHLTAAHDLLLKTLPSFEADYAQDREMRDSGLGVPDRWTAAHSIILNLRSMRRQAEGMQADMAAAVDVTKARRDREATDRIDMNAFAAQACGKRAA